MALEAPKREFRDAEEERLYMLGVGGTMPGTILTEDIAAAAAWLASDDARFVTGAQIPVDGGASTKP